MASKIVSDDLWTIVEPLLPTPQASPCGGRPPISNRAALTGIIVPVSHGACCRRKWGAVPALPAGDDYEIGSKQGSACTKRSCNDSIMLINSTGQELA